MDIRESGLIWSVSTHLEIQSIDACQICLSRESTTVLTKKRNHFTSTWVRCSNCESAHIDPYPSLAELESYYEDNYTRMDFTDSSDSQVKHCLRFSDAYHETVFNEYRLTMEQLKIDLDDLSQDKDILDFGCANGVFLRFLNSRGVSKQNLYGCDISSQMLEEAEIHSNNLFLSTEIVSHQNKFDLVTLWDVLEHIMNPKEHIHNIFKSLKHDGKLLIQTPNYGVLAEKFGEDFAHYLVLEHINLFSRKAAVELIESVGFRLVSEGSFGANIEAESCDLSTKKALDSIAKALDFGATQILLFQKN